MNIIGREKDIKKLKKIKTKLSDIVFLIDNGSNEPVITIKKNNGEFTQYLKGYKSTYNYLKYGFNRIIKKCPYCNFRKCIGEKCSLYFIDNGTGDCSHIWSLFRK